MKKLTSKQKHWSTLVEKWSNSGLSQAQYCRKNNITPREFYRWKQRLEKIKDKHDEDTGVFLPVVIEHPRSVPSITLSIAEVTVSYRHDTDPALLKQLLHVLREVA